MEISIIKTTKDYQKAMKVIDGLLDAPENSPEAERLELLSILVEDYENKHFQIETPDPVEAIYFRMEQLGLLKKDLEPSIGSRGRVSEVLNKKRNLTLPMIRKLNKFLNIPADILIQTTHGNKS